MTLTKTLFRGIPTAALALSLLLAGTACDKNKPEEPPIMDQENRTYTGTVKVDQNDGTFYEDLQVAIDVNFQPLTQTLTLLFHQVKFAQNMPVRLDMTVEGVKYVQEGETLKLSGNGLVPQAMGGPFPAFTITDLEGTLTLSSLDFSMRCGQYPTFFLGK